MSDLASNPLRTHGRPRSRSPARMWREWCFLRAVWRSFRINFLLLGGLLLGGALLFRWLEPERRHSLPKALYCTWALIFGEAPEEFPAAPVLQALFFLVPLIGLVVILEGLVDFALMLRDRQRNERSWCRIMSAAYSNHIVLVGLGKLGYRVFRMLRQLGEAVVVIEVNASNQFLEDIRRAGAPLFVGDARREALLADANAGQARAIVLATNKDLVNLEVALDARRLNPQIRVVLRMFDQNMADKICAGFGIQTAMSQSALSAPAFVLAALGDEIV
ncbi:MAG: NAD(P)-binding protein, partial [Planctomycetota bacterium]